MKNKESKRRTSRRAFLARALAFVGASAFALAGATDASELLDAETLKYQLRVKTKKEEEFVDDVVAKAKSGELPMKILIAARRRALEKSDSRRVLYFKVYLETLSKSAGLKIVFKSV